MIEGKGKAGLHPAIEMTLFLVGIPLLFFACFLVLAWLHSSDAMMTSLACVGVIGLIGFLLLSPTRK